MKVASIKVDSKGRLQLPKTFLDSNNIKSGDKADMVIIPTNHWSIRLVFEKDKVLRNG